MFLRSIEIASLIFRSRIIARREAIRRISSSTHDALVGERIDQQMEIDEAAPPMPAREDGAHAVVIELVAKAEVGAQAIAPTDIIARKNTEPPEAAQQHILGGPA